ncbi:MAG TPA: UDP-2,4-diacetamido-2,4,6-trideoxy-beta-L-altropyranose hydrolase [Thermoanaerobaculia bacterium]
MTSLVAVTEGGSSVGLGHIRRCLTLAAALRKHGVDVAFRVAGGEAAEAVARDAGFAAESYGDLASVDEMAALDADAVLIDSYRATTDVFRACRATTIAMDDLADRALPVDMVINTTIGASRLAYDTRGVLLLGPRYALLRPEFEDVPPRAIRERIERVMITLGGSDHGTLASDIVRSCIDALPDATIDVVIGPFFERLDLLRAFGERVVLLERPHMRDLMLRSDLAISSGGQTLFELAATGTPAIVITTADNQVQHARDFAGAGSLVMLDDGAFERVRDVAVRAAMSERGRALVDGRGAERTASAIVELLKGTR